ncbi:helix-turn-helix domain-containing protein [Streptomyces incarnatus]
MLKYAWLTCTTCRRSGAVGLSSESARLRLIVPSGLCAADHGCTAPRNLCLRRDNRASGGKVPRPERLLDPTAGPLEAFAHDLRALRRRAGNPSYRTMAKRAHYSVSTLAEAARGLHKPSLKVTLAYVDACGGDLETWSRRWQNVCDKLEADDAPVPERPDTRRESRRSGRPPAPRGAPRDVRTDDGLTRDEKAELLRLRLEVEELRRANEVLKAASAIFAADLRTTRKVVYNSAGRQDRLV